MNDVLPDFPAIKEERLTRLKEQAWQESMARHPILPDLRSFTQHEGDGFDMGPGRHKGDPSGYEKFETTLSMRYDELPMMDDSRLLERLKQMTDKFADEQMKLFIRRIDEAAKAGKGFAKAGEGPPTEDKLLDMIEQSDLDFEDGKIADGFSFLMHPSMMDQFKKMPVAPDGQKRFEQIIERKQLEWRLRQADRKLVD